MFLCILFKKLWAFHSVWAFMVRLCCSGILCCPFFDCVLWLGQLHILTSTLDAFCRFPHCVLIIICVTNDLLVYWKEKLRKNEFMWTEVKMEISTIWKLSCISERIDFVRSICELQFKIRFRTSGFAVASYGEGGHVARYAFTQRNIRFCLL